MSSGIFIFFKGGVIAASGVAKNGYSFSLYGHNGV